MVERLNDRLDAEVRNAMRPFGYYAPTVQSSVELLESGRDWRVHLKIEPGPPVILRATSVTVTGPGENEKMFRDILANTDLQVRPPTKPRRVRTAQGRPAAHRPELRLSRCALSRAMSCASTPRT